MPVDDTNNDSTADHRNRSVPPVADGEAVAAYTWSSRWPGSGRVARSGGSVLMAGRIAG